MIEFADEADIQRYIVARLDEIAEGPLLLGRHVPTVGEREVLCGQLVYQVPLAVLLARGTQTRYLVVRQLAHVLFNLPKREGPGC